MPVGCVDDADCAQGEICDVEAGICVVDMDWTPCLRNDDCPQGQVCGLLDTGDDLVAACIPEVGPGVHGSPCAANEDCRSGSAADSPSVFRRHGNAPAYASASAPARSACRTA